MEISTFIEKAIKGGWREVKLSVRNILYWVRKVMNYFSSTTMV